ncbi:MAG: shikimate dehydrogenase [Pseudomonadota bacterium]
MKVFCILSDERAYLSRSPAMFSAVLARNGIKGAYVPFKVAPENLGHALQSLKYLNIAGANVTVPYKEAVIPFLDILSEGANIIGAINTIVCTGSQLKGYNTNAIGIMDALSEIGFDIAGKSALVIGTGGAAKAVAFILNWLRADTVFITGRNAVGVDNLVNRFGGKSVSLDQVAAEPLAVELVVNATSASSAEEAPELAELALGLTLPRGQLMMDLNYGRRLNIWEQAAIRLGIRFVDGLPALAYQARRTFALWTGLQVHPDEFLAALGKGSA